MLDSKTAIVTGGTSGIGRAIAEKYLDWGANVVIAGRREDVGQETATDLGCTFFQCDVANYEQVDDLVESTVDNYGSLDVIVNNAGIGQAAPLGEMSVDDWQQVLQVNLDGVMYGSKAALPHLVESDGSIVNVASIFGLVGGPGAPAYSAAKGGVVNLTRTIAIDYASDGVRANVICPGFVETAMVEEYLGQEQFYDFVRGETPIGRVAQPDEIGGIAAFLASDEASYITGAAIPVDGGWTAH
ncbi:SDR family NAD(P)-dependent oxidoreductase [Natrinema sp. 1APR25-10V2]|uniref:SDR family NAD(P)-dependent oxidoreductase n=1 Tax=Natrinema sp. 1APR25-10V2 TaxID=2951081 RepID=UPI0028755306|nr:SDR family NAD(P)-dependent oxidoreductase [Natrinema sp. 1APR25-10V2]MDS0478126.1 SDR family oxidoreductase [Natrinema sp. 1APR25-10V2]